MLYRIRLSAEASRELSHLPGHVRQRFRTIISSLADNPRPAEARELRGLPGAYRIRIDRFRLVYEVDCSLVYYHRSHRRPSSGE